MTKILVINILAVALIPAIMVWILKNTPSKFNLLIISLSTLVLINLYKVYGFTPDFAFSYTGFILLVAPCIMSFFFLLPSSNKHLKLKKVKAIYQDQIQLKIVPFKYKLVEFMELYFVFLAFLFMCALFILGFGSGLSVTSLSPDSLFSTPAQSDIWMERKLVAIFGVFISAILYFKLKKIRLKMLPIFWRAQLLPVFNPESEIYKSITEITDMKYLHQIFEVNDFSLIEISADRVEQYNKNLNYIIQHYPLNVLNIQQKLYLAATTIAVAEIQGNFHFYFVKLKDKETPPPPATNKVEPAQDKANISVEVSNA